jgi:hypothetical protein
MKYLLSVNPLLLKDSTLGIGDLVDVIRKENPNMYFSTGFINHSKNSVEITSGKEFQEYIENTFKNQIQKGIISFGLMGSNHNSSHKTFKNEYGYIVCGCGWIESFEERRDRETKEQLGEMKIIKMEL